MGQKEGSSEVRPVGNAKGEPRRKRAAEKFAQHGLAQEKIVVVAREARAEADLNRANLTQRLRGHLCISTSLQIHCDGSAAPRHTRATTPQNQSKHATENI